MGDTPKRESLSAEAWQFYGREFEAGILDLLTPLDAACRLVDGLRSGRVLIEIRERMATGTRAVTHFTLADVLAELDRRSSLSTDLSESTSTTHHQQGGPL